MAVQLPASATIGLPDFNFPNGRVYAYYGNAASCKKQVMDANDYVAALSRAVVAIAPKRNNNRRNDDAERGRIGHGQYSGYMGNI